MFTAVSCKQEQNKEGANQSEQHEHLSKTSSEEQVTKKPISPGTRHHFRNVGYKKLPFDVEVL